MLSTTRFVLDNPDSVKDMVKDIRRSIKKAASDTMNWVAFEARINIVDKAKQSMIIRNDFLHSTRVLQVKKVPFGHTESLKDISSSVGFTEDADFMRRQDEGGFHEAGGRSGGFKSAARDSRLWIFTDKAREGGVKTGKVKRLAHYQKNKQRAITIPHVQGKNSRAALRVRMAAIAYKSGLLMYFRHSLYQVTSFEKKGDSVHFEKQMIINREYERTYTPAKNFFFPACQEAVKDMQRYFNEEMERYF